MVAVLSPRLFIDRIAIIMKTIFLSIYDGDQEKIFLRSSFLDELKRAGHRIILLIRAGEGDIGEKKIAYYAKEFGGERVIVEKVRAVAMTRKEYELYFYHVSWNSISSFTTRLKRHDLYLTHRNVFRYALESVIGWLGHLYAWRQFIRWVYWMIPEHSLDSLFETYKPDLVFASNMFSPEDCKLLKVAKKRKVPTVTTMKSWDVPTTRGFTRVMADRILVFNDVNKAETHALGDYPLERIRVMGFPQFDVYTRKELILPRAEFFRKIGADPQKKLILFAVPGYFKHPNINEILQGLNDAITSGRISQPVQVLARFHPKYPSPAEQMKTLPHFILDRPGTYFGKQLETATDAPSAQTFQWTFTSDDIIHLANSLFHSDVVVNVESTISLDAAAFDRPVIMIAYDGVQKQLEYWHSVRRNYDREHFQAVLKSGGVRLAKTQDELIVDLNRYLDDPACDAEGRQRLREAVLYRVDGHSAMRAAQYVLEMLVEKNPK